MILVHMRKQPDGTPRKKLAAPPVKVRPSQKPRRTDDVECAATAHGFGVAMIARLVNRGLASLTHEKVRAGGELVEVGKLRITAAGLDALAEG